MHLILLQENGFCVAGVHNSTHAEVMCVRLTGWLLVLWIHKKLAVFPKYPVGYIFSSDSNLRNSSVSLLVCLLVS